jgi:hypothetical protein
MIGKSRFRDLVRSSCRLVNGLLPSVTSLYCLAHFEARDTNLYQSRPCASDQDERCPFCCG